MSWFSTGDDAEKKLKEESKRQEEAKKERAKNNIRRWWMRPTEGDEGSFVTFLDADKHPDGYKMPFAITEHQLYRNGHWRNWYTCIDGEPDPDTGEPMVCPLCKSGDKPYYAEAYTIINESEWTDKKDQVHVNEINMFVCKTAVAKQIGKARRKRKGLRGWRVEITRTGSDAPNTGDVFEFDTEIIDPGDDKQPLDYPKIFAPRALQELQDIVEGNVPDDATVGADDDKVRF